MIKQEMENVIVREFVADDFKSFKSQLCNNPGWNQAFQLWNVNDQGAIELFAYHLKGYEDMDLRSNRLMYGIFTKSGLLVGECGFEFNPNYNAVEIFVGLIEQARGKGFSKEVINALVNISKEIGLNVVHANIPSQHEVGVKMLESSLLKFESEYAVEFQGNEIAMRHYMYKN